LKNKQFEEKIKKITDEERRARKEMKEIN